MRFTRRECATERCDFRDCRRVSLVERSYGGLAQPLPGCCGSYRREPSLHRVHNGCTTTLCVSLSEKPSHFRWLVSAYCRAFCRGMIYSLVDMMNLARTRIILGMMPLPVFFWRCG